MNDPWAVRLDRADAPSLAALRLVADVEVAEAPAGVWVRGRPGGARVARLLSFLPAAARYEWRPPDGLRRIDSRIAADRLPAADWRPLAAWLGVAVPPAALPAVPPPRVALRLVRSTAERPPDLLLTTMEEWRRFAVDAPAVRLDRLRFAADGDGRVVVLGRPLPPLPGRRFALHDAVAVPLGYAWRPAVGADVVARLSGAGAGALALWHEDGAVTRLSREHFVPASRNAVTETQMARIP